MNKMNIISYMTIFVFAPFVNAFFFHNGFDLKDIQIKTFQNRVQKIDDNLYDLLSERMDITNDLYDLNATDKDACRDAVTLSRLKKKKKLDAVFTKQIWGEIFKEKRRLINIKDDEIQSRLEEGTNRFSQDF